jgi:DNA helicase-2/ATP-dependent DNA helicase PcrA
MILDESGLKDTLYSQAEDSEEGALAVQAISQWFGTLRDFEQVTDLASALSYLDNLEALKADGESISDDSSQILNTLPVVMSVHKSKGLEWQVVYIIDCVEGSFPLKKSSRSLTVPEELVQASAADDHYSEERRLMYVATTRARDELIMTHCESYNGKTKRKPSRFIAEMFGQPGDELHDSLEQESLNLFDASSATNAKITIPGTMLSGKNLTLTASQANDYLRCPQDFKYRYILGVPAPPNPQSIIGTSFHSYIQQVNDAKVFSHPIPPLAPMLEELEAKWPKEGYLSLVQRDRALTHSLKALEITYARLLEEPVPIASEKPFRIHIPDSRLILKGRMDVVMPTENGVEIRDYKTSTSATTPEKAKASAQRSKQLDMYALAWRLTTNEMPASVALDFVQTNQIGRIKKQAKTLDTLEKILAEMAENILAGKFEPGYSHDYCRHPVTEEA